jgi:c-di-GMP-binding flagellar brake protein YcgR
MIERRNFTRVDFEAEAIVTCGKRVVKGRSENVSLKGLFFRTSEKLELGKDIKIKLFLHGLEDQFVDLSGKVMRQQDGGFGVQFAHMDFSAFMDLKRIVSLLVGDESMIISEFTNSLHLGDPEIGG